jgi:hypothetical protein
VLIYGPQSKTICCGPNLTSEWLESCIGDEDIDRDMPLEPAQFRFKYYELTNLRDYRGLIIVDGRRGRGTNLLVCSGHGVG